MSHCMVDFDYLYSVFLGTENQLSATLFSIMWILQFKKKKPSEEFKPVESKLGVNY